MSDENRNSANYGRPTSSRSVYSNMCHAQKVNAAFGVCNETEISNAYSRSGMKVSL